MNATTTNPLLSQAQPPAASFLSILCSATDRENGGQTAQDSSTASRNGENAANAEKNGGQRAASQKVAAQKNVPHPPAQAATIATAGSGTQVVRSGAKTSDALTGNATSPRAAKENSHAVSQADWKPQPVPVNAMVPAANPPQAREGSTTLQAPAESGEPAGGAEITQASDVANRSQAVSASEGTTEYRTAIANSIATKGQAAPTFGFAKGADANAQESDDDTTGTVSDATRSATTASPSAVATTAVAQKISFLAGLSEMALPTSPATPSSAAAANPTGKVQEKSADAQALQNTSPAGTPDKSHTAGSTSTSSSTVTPNSPQVAGAAGQHTQTDGAQVSNVAKNADSPAVSVPTQAPAQIRHEGSADGARPAEVMHMPAGAAEANEGAGTAGINTAKLIQTLSQTEMHVGLRSVEFGDISIRTAFSQQQMFAQISVDHGDLGRAIAAATPGLQTRLGNDFGVLTSIQVNHGGASFSNGGGTTSQQQPQRSTTRPAHEDNVAVSVEAESPVVRLAPLGSDEYRLDIRA